MIDALSEDADFSRRIEERVAARKQDRFAPIDPVTLAWMVLVPSWTEDLARACEFPAVVAEAFPRLEQAGLFTRSKRAFWMPDAERAQARAFLLGSSSREVFDDQAAWIARALLRSANDPSTPLSPPLARWADLALSGLDGPAHLRTQIREALARREAGVALGWLDSARYLEGLVSARYGAEIALSQRRIELFYRLGQDRHHLESFLERGEQLAAIEHLLAPDSPCWALHLLGMGGVGKTMLLRHVNVAQADTQRSIVARVDFDHLSPDFPVRRPGQLLVALAEELASNLDGERQQSILISFHGYIAGINEQLSAEPPPADPLDNLKHPLFERILVAFGDLLASLPQPPLFILDTCEELAKIDPVSAKIPGVEAMFSILERLHDRVRSLRVVLAGRRLLARGGAGWSVDQERLSREARQLPDPRGYLALHVLRGFTEPEVDSYLAARQITLGAPARAALLAQCPDAGGLPGLATTDTLDPAPRYNPFDVALYAGWIQDDPDLDLATLARADTDPYVERRILGRLESDDLRAAMPAFTLLRRFDRSALALLFPGDPERIDRNYRLLGEQEWTDYQSDGSGGALEINRALLPRINAYFEHPARRSSLEAARLKLGPLLADALRAIRLEDCRIETIDAALRAVPVEEGAALWADFERRIALGSAFSWAVRVAGRLLGEGAAAAAESPLRIAIQATHTSAITHEQPTLDLGPTWEEIDQRAQRYPEDARMRALHARAVAGQIASARVTRKAPSSEQIDVLIGLVGEQLFHDEAHKEQSLAAYAAALDAALDTGTKLASSAIVPLFGQHGREPSPLAAFLALLEARATAEAESPLRAMALFEAALQLATNTRADVASTGYLDWTPPGHLADRVRLEQERTAVAPLRDDAELRAQLTDACSRVHGIDAERWAATMLLHRLARGLVPGDLVNEVLQREQYDAARVLVCVAHRATPPLLVVVAHAIAAAGDPARALTLLDARLEAATIAGNDKPTIIAVQRAKLAVMHRFRIDPGPFALRLVDGPDQDLRLAARHALAFTSASTAGEAIKLPDYLAVLQLWLGLGATPSPVPSGREPRALAESALITVERDALLDSRQGVARLLEVSSAFIHADDAVGALMAAIAAALASARADARIGELQTTLAVAALHYRKVAAALGEGVLPGYEALQAHDITACLALIDKAPVGWQEWLFRLIVCLHLARRQRSGDGDPALASALEASYGARLPEELRFPAAPSVSPASAPAARIGVRIPVQEQLKAPSGSRLQSWMINGIIGLIGLGAVGGILYSADRTGSLLDNYFHGRLLALYLAIFVIGLLFTFLLSADRKGNREFAREFVRNVFFDFPRALLFARECAIQIEASGQEPRPLVLRIERSTRSRIFPDREPIVEAWSAELARPALSDAYATVSATLEEPLLAGISVLRHNFAVRERVSIFASRSESMLPWEAYLRHAGSTTRTASERHLYRPVPASVVGRRRRSSLWNAVVTLHHDAQDRWVKSLWSATAFGEFNHAALVHAIGIPVRRSSGMRLRVDRDDVSHPLDEEQLFQAHLVVLQLPVIDSGVRTATDRQQVADLRELAFDAASGGAAFVLVIPALEEEDAVLLITALATRLGKKKPSLDHLLSITEHLRSLLLRPEDPRAAELRELAYDITLFAAETGPLPGGKTTK